MSGIFGIFYHDQQPVSPTLMQKMAEAMAYWGPDGSGRWQNGPIGLGQMLLHNTPEAVYEKLPRQGNGGVVLTANARIDNRQELLDEFQVPVGDRSIYPDSELILQAYYRWGEDCVHHLIGDWAFAIWNPRQQRLFIARDHLGINSIYYHRNSRFFAFASCLKALLALPEVPRQPNLFRVAQVLTSWPGDGVHTAYQDIHQLSPAHTITLQEGEFSSQRYWRLEDTPTLTLSSDQEYLEAFLAQYRRAVGDRLRSYRPVGATLSGGLDSGSVCALAAQALRPETLRTFTHVPLQPTDDLTSSQRFGDESPYVEANREFLGNLDVNYLRSEQISPLTGIEESLWVHDQPGHAAGNFFWITDLLQTCQRQGLGTVLTGQMGNGTVSWTGMPPSINGWLALAQGNWSGITTLAQEQALSPWHLIKRYFLKPIALPLLAQARSLRTLGKNPWEDYSAINPEFSRSIGLGRAMREQGHDPSFTPSPNALSRRLAIIRPQTTAIGALWLESGAAYGLEVRDPTIDKRLTEFCFSLPNDQYHYHGQNRSLIRRSMAGLLPDKVRLNELKGTQAADIAHRVMADYDKIKRAVESLEQSELAGQVLDINKMHAVLTSLRQGITRKNSNESSTILLRGLMSGLFLLKFD